MKKILKIWPDLAMVAFFVLISFAYFYPANVEGLVMGQHDHVAFDGYGKESSDYLSRTGERTRWTNAIFGGMPTFQMAPAYDSTKMLTKIERLYQLYIPGYTWYIFVLLLGFYILLRALDFRVWMAALGAVLWAFSSYFFIIIAAGHIWKVMTLAYIPATIAGMVLVYKGKTLWGGLLTALFVALQIRSNHVQMSYYFLFVMGLMAVAYGINAWRRGRLLQFGKQTAVLVVAALLGVCMNLSNLYHTYEYSKETMRGKSELVKKNTANQTRNGLDRDYITQWSYGIGETWTLLVPNTKGGASVPIGQNERAMEKANPMYRSLYGQIGQYWGEQPGTSGPVYVGAFVLVLFVIGLLVVKGPMKWALLVATVLSIMLSWGKNMMWLTDLFLDYVPMYAKFRTVSSILVIAEFTIPLLGLLGLKELAARVEAGETKLPLYGFKGRLNALQCIYIGIGVCGGFALLFALMPGVFFPDYVSSSELVMLKKALPAEHFGAVISNLSEMRESLFVADAWRSFGFILAGGLVLLLFNARKIGVKVMSVVLLVLCLVDMWGVNRRYLDPENKDLFRPKRVIQAPQKTRTDEIILADKSLDYRVLNLAGNTFNENNTSYYHKSIGGYHAAKLRRYQELIEAHIHGEMGTLYNGIVKTNGQLDSLSAKTTPVLNMLNTRWVIMPAAGGGTMPVFNPHAMGNAWFVLNVKWVDNAGQELDALHEVNPAFTAVVDKKFADVVKEPSLDGGSIVLKEYEPNRLVYQTDSPEGGLVVFSEIYYPGWRSYVDGKEVPHGRADYVLRCMNLPAGQHTVEFVFEPESIAVTETIAYVALGLWLLALVGAGLWQLKKTRSQS